ncbi:hypothetical protein [Desulfosediminicola flagellatus]|uniref:hypothetical protein n=1 Tax=Desulfosediminicola flagellatus TaxID=2569541 RepID=UPI0010AC4B2C|nr:hypothetical protein [Desulfosediminicola flagellatus]
MNKKNIKSTLLTTIIIIPSIGILIFRVIDSYYGFKYTEVLVGPILEPFIKKYPLAVLIITGLYLGYRFLSMTIKVDVALKDKDEQ